ncbi:MAG: isfD [Verrucomicrobiales bacterium]|nr:isfD [Verrucomicrobiales bacterium]
MPDSPSPPFPFFFPLITGASSGFGAEFARQLAPSAKAMALTARRVEVLEELAASLRAAHPGLTVHCLPCDLMSESDRAALPARCTALNFTPDLLINNAGLGDYGTFAEAEWGKLHQMLAVNITALTHLTHLFMPALRTHPASGILNVSSLAGELPIPDFAVYAASKTYVTRFTEALRIELRPLGITVSALCPGPSPTGFGDTARRQGEHLPTAEFARKPPAAVVARGLKALVRNEAAVFPGFIVWLTSRLLRFLPDPLLRLVLGRRPRKARKVG